MEYQTQHVLKYLQNLVQNNSSFANGWHLVCHSQGALLCRAVIENWDGHNINTFISLAGPHLGQYGTDIPFPFLFNVTTEEAYLLLYTPIAQDTFSVAGYWHDPRHEQDYLTSVRFLPDINNVRNGSFNSAFKTNFEGLQQLVLLGSDGGLIPISLLITLS